VANEGQWQDPFLFRADVAGATVFLEQDGITWVKLQEDAGEIMHDMATLTPEEQAGLVLSGHAWRVRFVGAGTADVRAADPVPGNRNYFLGNDASRWRSNVGVFNSITYRNVWPGIDVVFHGTEQGNLKYDVLVHPGADPRLVVLDFDGLDGLDLQPDGSLALRTAVGEVREMAPVAFQENGRSPVDCAFEQDGRRVRFKTGSYDRGRMLVIDPELIASTYSGATGASNYGHCATYDDDGNIYTGARSFGSGYPTALGSFQTAFGGGNVDISLSKLNPDGSALIWASYLGGTGSEFPHSLIVNHQGQLCVLGSTTSPNFPVTAGAFQPTYAGETDMSVTVFSMDGGTLVGSTYVGGSGTDGLNAMFANYGESYRGEIMVDDAANILVASFTRSADFPTSGNAYQTNLAGQQDAVVLSLNNSCSQLLWSTYLGGAGNDGAFGIRQQDGNVFITGQTHSADLPTTPGAYQPALQGGQDGFVACFNANGSQLLASTFYGTAAADRPYFLDTDSDGNIWIYGQTLGTVPIVPADVFSEPGGKVFLAKFNPGLTDLLLSTAFGIGSSTVLTPVAFLVDRCDKIYVSGYEAFWSNLPTTPNALHNSGSFYLAAFDVDMSDLVFGTFYGGNHVDGGTSRFDKNGIVYQGVCVTGNGMASTPWAHAPTQGVVWDIGVFKIDFQVAGVTAAGASPVNQGCAPIEIQFSNSSTGTDWLWDFGDGSPPVAAFEPAHMYTEAGSYTVMLIASDSMACNLADTVTFQIDIGQGETYTAAFTTDQDPACSVTEIAFTNASTGSLMNFLWDMGDGSTYTDTNVVHTYAEPGAYTVQLLVSDPSGCSQPDSVQQAVQVVLEVALVQALATIVPPEPCVSMTFTGTNNSTGVAPTFQWIMGEGTILEQPDVVHTYAVPGTYTVLFVANDPATCNLSDTLSWEIEVSGSVMADLVFETELQQICATGQVQTINLSTGDGLQFHWDMGDGTEYSSFEVDHLYAEPGFYMIVLSATDPQGCADPMPHYVPVYVGEPMPVTAGFSVEFDHQCTGSLLSFTNFSGGENLSFEWSLGDGTTSEETDVEHFYSDSGEVLVQLVVQDLNGCLPPDTMQQAVLIPQPPSPDAAFEHTLLDNCQGGQFIGQTLNDGPIDYLWHMDDGTVLEGTYISHQFTEEGEHTVMLVAADPGVCGSDTSYATVTVVMPLLMDLSFDLVEEHQCGQTTVTCTNTSIGNNLTYIWWTSDDFSYYGPEMQHVFTEPGEYEIRFYGMDPMDCSGPDSVVVTVVVAPFEPVTAEFILEPSTDCSGTTVTAGTTNTADLLGYTWNMGDGTTYSDPQVQHQYSASGSYTVSLTVTDGSGCHEPQESMQELVVEDPPVVEASFQMETVPGCGTLEVMLQNSSSMGAVDLNWDLGDGTMLVGEAVAHVFDTPGTYAITLTVSDPASCNLTDSYSTSVTVDPIEPIAASFELMEEGECGEMQVTCTNTSTGSNVSYLWELGDGTTYATTDLVHTFSTPGTYSISLTVTHLNGCFPPAVEAAEVVLDELPPLAVELLVEQVGDCNAMTVEGTGLVTGTDLVWVWDMGDGSQYGSLNAAHAYASPGTYMISLTVTDTVCGRQASATFPVVVNDGVPQVLLSSPVLCPGSSVILDASATPGTYSWSTGSNEASIEVLEPGVYTVQVEGEDGCAGSTAVEVVAGTELVFAETVSACPNRAVELNVPLEGQAYAWSTGGTDQTVHVLGAGTYTFVVTDHDGCQHSGTYVVEALDGEAQLFAPNAFTPDGDGINDVFTVEGFGQQSAELSIYNRWGELLHRTKDYPPVWDGSFNGSTVKQDVYVYQLEYRSTCTAGTVSTIGHVTVVR
jgi:gliding motility-associated-like protein